LRAATGNPLPARRARGRPPWPPADAAEPRTAGEIAAAMIPPATPRRCGMRQPASIAGETVVAAHHGADAVEQHGPAHDTGHGRGSRAKKRAASAARGGAHGISALRISRWVSLGVSLGLTWRTGRLTCSSPRAPYAARSHPTCPHGRNGGPRLLAPGDRAADGVEKAAAAFGGRRNGAFELFNSGVGTLEEFVLHQHRLDQRVDRIGRAAEPLANQPFRIGVTPLPFQRGKAIEQVRNELLFLRSHGCSPLPDSVRPRAIIWGTTDDPEMLDRLR